MDRETLYNIIKRLDEIYEVKVRREKPFEVLIHGMLSHRTKDETTFPAQQKLLKIASTPEKILKLSSKRIEKIIYPVGFYRQKAKHIKQTCKILVEKYNGRIPGTRKELMELPGVGGKTADIVLLFAHGHGVIPVDTHVAVISKRWHVADKKDSPEKVRENLHRLIKEEDRPIVNQLLVQFGKEICKAPIPKCYMCPVEKLCPYENKNLKPKNVLSSK